MTLILNQTETLQNVTHMQSNNLWDVITLLDAVLKHVDAMGDQPDIYRLVRMASDRVRDVQGALDPYI